MQVSNLLPDSTKQTTTQILITMKSDETEANAQLPLTARHLLATTLRNLHLLILMEKDHSIRFTADTTEITDALSAAVRDGWESELHYAHRKTNDLASSLAPIAEHSERAEDVYNRLFRIQQELEHAIDVANAIETTSLPF